MGESFKTLPRDSFVLFSTLTKSSQGNDNPNQHFPSDKTSLDNAYHLNLSKSSFPPADSVDQAPRSTRPSLPPTATACPPPKLSPEVVFTKPLQTNSDNHSLPATSPPNQALIKSPTSPFQQAQQKQHSQVRPSGVIRPGVKPQRKHVVDRYPADFLYTFVFPQQSLPDFLVDAMTPSFTTSYMSPLCSDLFRIPPNFSRFLSDRHVGAERYSIAPRFNRIIAAFLSLRADHALYMAPETYLAAPGVSSPLIASTHTRTFGFIPDVTVYVHPQFVDVTHVRYGFNHTGIPALFIEYKTDEQMSNPDSLSQLKSYMMYSIEAQFGRFKMMGALVCSSYIILITLICTRLIDPSSHAIHPDYHFYITPSIPLYGGGMRLLYSLLTLPLSQLGVCTGIVPPSDVEVVNCIIPPQIPRAAFSTEGNILKLSSIPRWLTPDEHPELNPPLSQSLCVAKSYMPSSSPLSILHESYNPVAAKRYTLASVTTTQTREAEIFLYEFSPRPLSDLDSLLIPQGVDLQNSTLFLNDLGSSLHSFIASFSPAHANAAYAEYARDLVQILTPVLDQLCNLHAIGFHHNDLHLGNICTGFKSPLSFLFPHLPYGFLIDYGTSRPAKSPARIGHSFFKPDTTLTDLTSDGELEMLLKVIFYLFRHTLFTQPDTVENAWSVPRVGWKYSTWGPLVLFWFPAILFAPYDDTFSPPTLLPLYECLLKRRWLLPLLYKHYRKAVNGFSSQRAFQMKCLDSLQDFYHISLDSQVISKTTVDLSPCLPPTSVFLDRSGRLSHAALLLLHPLLYGANPSFEPYHSLLSKNLCVQFVGLINAISTLPTDAFLDLLKELKQFYTTTSTVPPSSLQLVGLFKSRLTTPDRYFTSQIHFTSATPLDTIQVTLCKPEHADLNMKSSASSNTCFSYSADLNKLELKNGTPVSFRFLLNHQPLLSNLYPIANGAHIIRFLRQEPSDSSTLPDLVTADGTTDFADEEPPLNDSQPKTFPDDFDPDTFSYMLSTLRCLLHCAVLPPQLPPSSPNQIASAFYALVSGTRRLHFTPGTIDTEHIPAFASSVVSSDPTFKEKKNAAEFLRTLLGNLDQVWPLLVFFPSLCSLLS